MTPNTELQKAIERVEHEVKISSVSDFDPFKSDIEKLLSAAKQLQQIAVLLNVTHSPLHSIHDGIFEES